LDHFPETEAFEHGDGRFVMAATAEKQIDMAGSCRVVVN
jgi:hypothetical protein